MKHTTLNVIKEKGLNATSSREAILGVFSEDCKPLNAEDVFKKVKRKGINNVTVYRTLSSFEKKGIVKRTDLRRDSIYYELADASHHHHHLICIKCDTIEDFEMCNISSISKKALDNSSKFSTITEHSLELFGVCNSCLGSK